MLPPGYKGFPTKIRSSRLESSSYHICMHTNQGVWNRREIQLTRFTLPYDYACFADGYYICIKHIQNRLLYTR